jgi:hypothetical protein
MPDISASLDVLDATFFLYPSPEDARKGTKFGGSGVIVSAPLDNSTVQRVTYAVTNWHVACAGGSSVIRLNQPDGRAYIIDKDPSEWSFLPGRQDVAVTPLHVFGNVKASSIPTSAFITEEGENDAHVGDDIFMVGRFVDFDGHETNRPATRFGTLSMMDAPIKQPTGFRGRSIIVDMHSRTGFSGSPVYIYRPGPTSLMTHIKENYPNLPKYEGHPPSFRKWGIGNNVQVRLLGILWGQFPELWEIRDGANQPREAASLVIEGAYVRGFSGMSCVIPASQIHEILELPKLKSLRAAPTAHRKS